MAPSFEHTTDPEAPSPRDWRAATRRAMLAARRAMSTTWAETAQSALLAHLEHLCSANGRWPLTAGERIGFCWPIHGEPDLRPLMLHWRALGHTLLLPVVTAEAEPLAFRAWLPETHLVPDRYGIPTPADGDWLTPTRLLIPGAAFDHDGYRLGYGGGFFDRTLASLTPRPLAIGVGFSCNLIRTLYPAPHDIVMDGVVTENGLLEKA